MKKILAVGYGIVCYLLSIAVFLYCIGFIANVGVPKSIDTGQYSPIWRAIIIDAGLLILFALQHSGMARRGYKKWENRLIPRSLQRSTYILLASLAMILIFWQWHPLPAEVWTINLPWIRWLLWSGYALGWIIVITAPFMISHTELFGLKQVWLYRRNHEARPSKLKITGLYRYIRHPIMLGFLIAFWSTPQMTVGHLFFALGSSAYILFGMLFEERDLLHEFGEAYLAYRERVPRLIPGIPGVKLNYRLLKARINERS
jgi:protein-S-isoprenylcysteine O-methyltransferase Ste14